MDKITLTREQAKRFILSKQGLLGEKRFIGKTGVCEYVKQAGCIQFDPVDVCGKNAELTLFSRVKGFTKDTLSDLLYKDRLLVDYPDKELSIWHIDDWPYFSEYRLRSKRHSESFEGLMAAEGAALEYIEANGPASSADIPFRDKLHWYSSMHWSGSWHGETDAARSALEQLYTDGELVIHHKVGSRKYYDLASRYLPKEILSAENPLGDRLSALKWRIKRRIGAIGLLWNKRSDAFLGIDMSNEEREVTFASLLESGEIVEVAIEGINAPLYLLSSDLKLLKDTLSGNIDLRPRLELIAPLDPLLWDRKLIEKLWSFKYSWEIYTPPEKRRYGCYTLPMLFGSEFVGRVDAAADRKAGVLTVKNIWHEAGASVTKKLAAREEAALKRLARLNKVEGILYEGKN